MTTRDINLSRTDDAPDCEFCGETMTPGDRCGVEDCDHCEPEWICELCGEGPT
jgi:hypothetical protein